MQIEDRKFRETGSNEVVIPSSVEILGRQCFFNTVRLQFIKVERRLEMQETSEDSRCVGFISVSGAD
jgi:hypothetical protein